MRVTVAGPVEAKRGQIVRFHARLRKGHFVAFLELYSAVEGFEPSPHIPLRKLRVYEQGKPQMMAATTFRLIETIRKEVLIELTAEEDCIFYLKQDVDFADDEPTVKATGRAYGKYREKALSAVRRLLGNPGWPVRRDDGEVYRIDG